MRDLVSAIEHRAMKHMSKSSHCFGLRWPISLVIDWWVQGSGICTAGHARMQREGLRQRN